MQKKICSTFFRIGAFSIHSDISYLYLGSQKANLHWDWKISHTNESLFHHQINFSTIPAWRICKMHVTTRVNILGAIRCTSASVGTAQYNVTSRFDENMPRLAVSEGNAARRLYNTFWRGGLNFFKNVFKIYRKCFENNSLIKFIR